MHLKSFVLGTIVGAVATGMFAAQAIDLGTIAGGAAKVGGAVKRLAGIKSNLDKDVTNLKSDATTLLGDKNSLVEIRNKLVQLSTQTKSQIDAVGTLVGVVEGHLTHTQSSIASTAKNVGEIDEVRKSLN